MKRSRGLAIVLVILLVGIPTVQSLVLQNNTSTYTVNGTVYYNASDGPIVYLHSDEKTSMKNINHFPSDTRVNLDMVNHTNTEISSSENIRVDVQQLSGENNSKSIYDISQGGKVGIFEKDNFGVVANGNVSRIELSEMRVNDGQMDVNYVSNEKVDFTITGFNSSKKIIVSNDNGGIVTEKFTDSSGNLSFTADQGNVEMSFSSPIDGSGGGGGGGAGVASGTSDKGFIEKNLPQIGIGAVVVIALTVWFFMKDQTIEWE